MPMDADYGLILHGSLTQPELGELSNDANTTEYSTYQYTQEAAGVAPTLASDIIGRTAPDPPTMPIGGIGFGLHILVTVTYASIASMIISILAGPTTSPTTLLTTGPTYAAADMVAGKHHFIPLPPTFAKYIRAKFVTNATDAAGKLFAWLGPGPAGATA